MVLRNIWCLVCVVLLNIITNALTRTTETGVIWVFSGQMAGRATCIIVLMDPTFCSCPIKFYNLQSAQHTGRKLNNEKIYFKHYSF